MVQRDRTLYWNLLNYMNGKHMTFYYKSNKNKFLPQRPNVGEQQTSTGQSQKEETGQFRISSSTFLPTCSKTCSLHIVPLKTIFTAKIWPPSHHKFRMLITSIALHCWLGNGPVPRCILFVCYQAETEQYAFPLGIRLLNAADSKDKRKNNFPQKLSLAIISSELCPHYKTLHSLS